MENIITQKTEFKKIKCRTKKNWLLNSQSKVISRLLPPLYPSEKANYLTFCPLPFDSSAPIHLHFLFLFSLAAYFSINLQSTYQLFLVFWYEKKKHNAAWHLVDKKYITGMEIKQGFRLKIKLKVNTVNSQFTRMSICLHISTPLTCLYNAFTNLPT